MVLVDLIVLIQYLLLILVQNYTSAPTVTISDPETISGVGTYQFNEVVQGMRSGTQARVKSWDVDTGILQLVMLELEQQQQDSSKVKILKDLHLVHYSVLSNFDDDTAPINIMKEIYLSQKQT